MVCLISSVKLPFAGPPTSSLGPPACRNIELNLPLIPVWPKIEAVTEALVSMRLLIISPHFPPVNGADMQRIRLFLPYLQDWGISAEVLCVDPLSVAAPRDGWLEEALPRSVPIHRVGAMGLEWGRVPGLGTLTFRALGALRRTGDALLNGGAFDLIYFSTTQFGLHVLGPEWKRKFGVPFVMDYQDPWVSDYYREHPDVVPPGGRLKYAVSSWLSRRQEPLVLRCCSGITSVSAAYPRQLQARYPWLEVSGEEGRETRVDGRDVRDGEKESAGREEDAGDSAQEAGNSVGASSTAASDRHRLPSLVIPFPGDHRDLARVKADGTRQDIFDPNDGLSHWVYIGVCPPPMDLTLAAYFFALGDWLSEHHQIRKSLRIHFVGTSYAKAGTGKSNVMKLAWEAGVHDVVDEKTDRIPYSQTLRCLLDADALIVLGTDDPGYTASKIYPYLLAGKPLLTVFHEESSVVRLAKDVGGAVCVPFASGESPGEISLRIRERWLDSKAFAKAVPLDEVAFEPYTAAAQAAQLEEFFNFCLSNS
jgi:hypothetical protein